MVEKERTQKCVTHHICDCLMYRLEAMEEALKKIQKMTELDDELNKREISEIKLECDEALKEINPYNKIKSENN